MFAKSFAFLKSYFNFLNISLYQKNFCLISIASFWQRFARIRNFRYFISCKSIRKTKVLFIKWFVSAVLTRGGEPAASITIAASNDNRIMCQWLLLIRENLFLEIILYQGRKLRNPSQIQSDDPFF